MQRLVHNWVRPHVGLGKNKTLAMAIRLYYRPISMIVVSGKDGSDAKTYLEKQINEALEELRKLNTEEKLCNTQFSFNGLMKIIAL